MMINPFRSAFEYSEWLDNNCCNCKKYQPDAPFDETDAAWGDEPRNEDDWLLSQRPPHWGNGR